MKKLIDFIFEMYCIITCIGAFVGVFASYLFIPLHGKTGFFVSLMLTNFVLDFLLNKYVKEDDEN